MTQSDGSVRQSLAFSLVERYGSLLISLVSTIVLSRILTPSDIGVYSVAIAAIGLAQTLRDFGITKYLIQVHKVDEPTIRTALTLSFMLSFGLGMAVFLSGPLLAHYYNQPGIESVVNVVSINMILIPFGATLMAMLHRELRFREIAKINLWASVSGACVSVLCALSGLGFMSLAYGTVSGVVVTTLGVVFTNGRLRWFKPSLMHWRSLLHFGGYASTAALVGEINARIPEFALARSLGFDAVGMFGKAYSAVYLVTATVLDSVGSVFLPLIARTLRTEEDCGDLYCRSLNYVTAIVLPVYAAIMILAAPIIYLLYGNQWGAAAPVASALALAAAVNALSFGLEHVLIAAGRVRRLLLLRSISIGPTLFVFLIVPQFGLAIVALSTVPIALLYVSAAYITTASILRLRFKHLICIFARNFFVAAVAAVPAAVIRPFWDGTLLSAVFVLAAYSLAGTITWIVVLRVLDHALLEEINRVLMKLSFITPKLRAFVIGPQWNPPGCGASSLDSSGNIKS